MPNEELIRTVIKRIERDLVMWDQDSWGSVVEEGSFWDRPTEIVAVPREAADEGMLLDEVEVRPISDLDLSQPQILSCGTSFCFAGHTVLEAGDAMLVNHAGEVSLCRTPEGQVRHVFHRAMELLGLDEDQAGQLFSAGINDFEDLKGAIACETGIIA